MHRDGVHGRPSSSCAQSSPPARQAARQLRVPAAQGSPQAADRPFRTLKGSANSKKRFRFAPPGGSGLMEDPSGLRLPHRQNKSHTVCAVRDHCPMQPTAEQFTEQAWAAIVSAQQLAQSSRHQQLETEHLLLALLREDGLAGRILNKIGVDTNGFEARCRSPPAAPTQHGSPPESVFLGRGVNGVLDRAESTARDASTTATSPIEHLLLALSARMIAVAVSCSTQAGVDGTKAAQRGHQSGARQPDGDRPESGGDL